MNKLDSFKPDHLELRKAGRTFFHAADGKKYSVKDASAAVFDSWVTQFVETIESIDRSVWDIFHRWGIINAVLEERLLCIVVADGDFLLVDSLTPEAKPEEKASGLASENEEVEDLEVEAHRRIESPGYNELGEDEPLYVHPEDRR